MERVTVVTWVVQTLAAFVSAVGLLAVSPCGTRLTHSRKSPKRPVGVAGEPTVVVVADSVAVTAVWVCVCGRQP